MLAILQQFLSVLQVVFTSVVSFFQATLTLLVRIPEFVLFLQTSTLALPPVILTFITFGIVLSLLLMILGRN